MRPIKVFTRAAVVFCAVASCVGVDAVSPKAAPREGALTIVTSATASVSGGDSFVRCRRRHKDERSADIGPRGGHIEVAHNKLEIPAGALSETVHITASVSDDDRAFVSFAPSGLVFRKPARLVIDVHDCDLKSGPKEKHERPYVVYVDDDDRIVERIEGKELKRKHAIAAPIRHFSGYAIAW